MTIVRQRWDTRTFCCKTKTKKSVMSRIWRRIPVYLQNESLIPVRTRLSSRSGPLSTSAHRYDDNDDDGAAERPSAAKNLLSTLTGLKVEKSLSSKVGSLPKLRSAAADFRDLLGRKTAADEASSNAGAKTKKPDDVQRMVVETAKMVAQIFPEKEVVESDLLRQLRKHDEATAAGKHGDVDAVSSILSGIKVEKQTATQRESDRTRSLDERALAGAYGSGFEMAGETELEDRTSRGQKPREAARRQYRKTLFDRSRLNIFTPPEDDTRETQDVGEASVSSLWDKEEGKHLKQLTYSSINSGFDEMMKWTEEGKTWHFPIDNEQGLEEEQQVPFHEHIFFDHLLEDLPPIEPIQNFMELVCLGLSQNPYLTVQQKHDHIHWFKTYFQERADVIREAVEAERADESRETAS